MVDKAMFIAVIDGKVEIAKQRVAHLEELLPVLKESLYLLREIQKRADDDELTDEQMAQIILFYAKDR